MSNDNKNVNDGNLINLNVDINPFDAEAQKKGGMFTRKAVGKFCVYVPPGAMLVKEDRFTGEVTWEKGSGLKFMVPFMYKTHFVLASQVSVDYEKVKYQTADGIDANVDFALFVRIVDPTKYKIASAKPMENLKLYADELIKNYVRAHNYDYLVKDNFSLDKIDPNGKLRRFCNDNGIEVVDGKFKKIELPEHLKKIFDDKVEAENEKKVTEVKNDIEKLKKQAEIERFKLEVEGYVNVVKQMIPSISNDDLVAIVKMKFGAKNSYYMDGKSGVSMDDVVRSAIFGENIVKNINRGMNNSTHVNNNSSNSNSDNNSYSFRGRDLHDNVYHVDDNNEDVDLRKFKGRR